MESPKVVRILGWDLGHHEELRNGPEVKIYIWEVIFRVPKKFGNFLIKYREGSRRFRGFHHGSQRPRKVPHRSRGGSIADMGWLHHSPRHMSFKSRDKILSLNLKG